MPVTIDEVSFEVSEEPQRQFETRPRAPGRTPVDRFEILALLRREEERRARTAAD
jgi:hypothetical protein